MAMRIERTGIFAGLRRRRWALSLAIGYALLLNALLGTSVEGAVAAARGDPLAAMAAAPLCSPGDPAPADPHHAPADHQQTCPLCGPACPMGGCAPLQAGSGVLALSAPREVTLASVDGARRDTTGGRSLYFSDTDSQGPPAA
ncbi:MAG: hypothetical protein ABUL54_05760 [Dongia sp.]|jgi:hypothetical protein